MHMGPCLGLGILILQRRPLAAISRDFAGYLRIFVLEVDPKSINCCPRVVKMTLNKKANRNKLFVNSAAQSSIIKRSIYH